MNIYFNEIPVKIILMTKFVFCFKIAPLHIAVQNGNTEIVQLLLSTQSLDVNKIYILN